MTTNNENRQPPDDDPTDDFDAIAASNGLHDIRPWVRAEWCGLTAEFQVGLDDNIPMIARWKILDEACGRIRKCLDPDCVQITKTSHAWVAQVRIAEAEVTVPFPPHGDWHPMVREQLFAMVVAALAVDPWSGISWVE